jgi:hypothetical protein
MIFMLLPPKGGNMMPTGREARNWREANESHVLKRHVLATGFGGSPVEVTPALGSPCRSSALANARTAVPAAIGTDHLASHAKIRYTRSRND